MTSSMQRVTFTTKMKKQTFSGIIRDCVFKGDLVGCSFNATLIDCTFEGTVSLTKFAGSMKDCVFMNKTQSCEFLGSIEDTHFIGGRSTSCTYDCDRVNCVFVDSIGPSAGTTSSSSAVPPAILHQYVGAGGIGLNFAPISFHPPRGASVIHGQRRSVVISPSPSAALSRTKRQRVNPIKNP